MSTLHPKFLISIYDNKLQFNEEPYENNRKHAIYTPKDDDYMDNLLTKHAATVRLEKEKILEKEQEIARRRAKRHEALLSFNSPKAGNYHIKQNLTDSDGFQLTESHDLSPSMVGEASKVKSKLQKELDLAKSFEQPTDKKEIKFLNQTTQKEETHNIKDSIDRMYASVSPKNFAMTMTEGFQAKSPNHSKSTNSWNRNIKVRTGTNNIFGKQEESPLRKTLYFDPRISALPKKAIVNPVYEDLIEKEQIVMSNPELLSSIMKLKEMKLLNQNKPGVNKFKGVGKIDYVYNDFHSRHTNPGYSRNSAGAFYCR